MPASGQLVPPFRSSCTTAAPPSTNFGKQRALANLRFSSAAFDLKFLLRTRGNLGRNFKSAAPAPHGFAVRDRRLRLKHHPRPSHPASTFVTTRTPLL